MSVRGRKFPAEPLDEHEVIALIRACSRKAPTGIRNAALIAVLWRGGEVSDSAAFEQTGLFHTMLGY